MINKNFNRISGAANNSLILHAFVFQHKVNLFGSDRSLQLLSIQHFIFQLLDGFARFDERLRYLTVTAT